MIFSNTSKYMLKYQKAKAKLVEYDIQQKDYPKFPLNSNELSYDINVSSTELPLDDLQEIIGNLEFLG